MMNLHLWVTYSGDHTAAQARRLHRDVAALRRRPRGRQRRCSASPSARRWCARSRASGRGFEVRWVPGRRRRRCCVALLVVLAVRGRSRRAPRRRGAPRRALAPLPAATPRTPTAAGAARPARRSSRAVHGLGGARARRRRPQPARRRRARARSTTSRAHAGELDDLGELERTILVLGAAGRDAARVGGRDLVAELLAAQRANGSLRRPREHDRVRGARAARGRAPRPRARSARAGALDRAPGEPRRRLQLRRPRRPVRDRRHRRGAAGAWSPPAAGARRPSERAVALPRRAARTPTAASR